MIKFLLDIVSTPAILVALIAILGLVLQKKAIPDIIKGGIKTFVGFLVVSGGAGIIQSSLNPFGTMFEKAFHLSGVVPNNEAIVAVALTTYGSATAMIMFAGMVFNILIARFTRFKYIFLTGHHTLYMACMIAVILSVAGFTNLPLILLGGLALGIIMSLSPAFVQKYMVQLTGNDKVALGHFSSLGYWLSGFVGGLVGDKSKSAEDIKFPKSLAFLRDSTVSITISMSIIYLIVAIFAGSGYIEKELSSGTSGLVYALQLAGQFAAGVFVILAGVRLILGEIVPAFKGISEGRKEIMEHMDDLPDNVHFLGLVERDRMNEFFNMGDVMLQLSFEELFPMTILESMNANIPLLLRDLPEYKPILFDYYLKANSQQTFKDELTKLKEDADYYAKACEGSKRGEQFYSKESILEQWQQFYDKVATERNLLS